MKIKITSDWIEKHTTAIVIAPLLVVLLATISVFIFECFQSGSWKLSYANNGVIGDFFGGIMNPVVALLALVWLRKGVKTQQSELLETKNALQESANMQSLQVRISALTALIQSELMDAAELEKRLEEVGRDLQAENANRKREMQDPNYGRWIANGPTATENRCSKLEDLIRAYDTSLLECRYRRKDYAQKLKVLSKTMF